MEARFIIPRFRGSGDDLEAETRIDQENYVSRVKYIKSPDSVASAQWCSFIRLQGCTFEKYKKLEFAVAFVQTFMTFFFPRMT